MELCRAASRRAGRASVAVTLIAVLGLTPSLGQTSSGHSGQMGVYLPERTQEGDWDGTWYYTSVEMKMVLWLRTHKGKTAMKLKYESGQRPVTFETDWNGDASYYTAEKPATFQVHVTKSDPGQIEGTWFWETQYGRFPRIEQGTFVLFRALDGRTMMFKFTDFELSMSRQGQPYRSNLPPLWTFLKASKRQALWDEIPF